jgi:hypothetical protein
VGVVTDGIDPRRFGRARRPCLSDNMLFVLALMASGCGPPDPTRATTTTVSWSGRATLNRGQRCGEWIEDGETVTYDPCPPGLEDGN